METHEIQAVVLSDGKLEGSNLPFQAVSRVEAAALEREVADAPTFPHRGTGGEMHEPFEPAVELKEGDVSN